MNETSEEVQTSHWFRLNEELRKIIILLLDNKSRRSLRATCLKNYRLVNKFRCMNYSTLYYCNLMERLLPDGQILFAMNHCINCHDLEDRGSVQYFATMEEMVECLQSTLQNVDTLKNFAIYVTGFFEPIQLLKHRRRLKVQNLSFNMSTDPLVVNDLLDQFDTTTMKVFKPSGSDLEEEVFGAYKIDKLVIDSGANIDSAQLWNVRARNVKLFGANELSISGLKNFFKKMLKKGETRSFVWSRMRRDQMSLFDHGTNYRIVAYINPTWTDLSLKLRLIKRKGEPLKLLVNLISRKRALRTNPTGMNPGLRALITIIERDQ